MQLELIRSYYPSGTNGEIFFKGKKVCSTIELPWLNNRPRISCIPEGKYEVIKRYSLKFGWHMQLKHVINRDLILIHPANDARKELKGCIAPVTLITSVGKGLQSRAAFKKIKSIVYPELEKMKQFFITIKSSKDVFIRPLSS